jgi:predicted transcriptional regulator/Flp pilus assembly pilin Flp
MEKLRMSSGFCNRVRRGVQSECGASLVEYALLLALVPAMGMIAYDAAGRTILSTFVRVGAYPSTVDPPPSAAVSPAADGPASTHRGPTQLTAPAAPGSWRDLLALATVLCLSVSLVVLRRTTKDSPVVEEVQLEDSEETADKSGPLFDKRQRIFRYLTNNAQAMFNSQLAVRQVMTTKLMTVGAGTPRAEIQALFEEQGIHHALVCDDHQRFLGVISDRDIMSRAGRTARDIMTPEPLSVAPDTTLGAALTLMLNHRISCVPVVDGGRLCGIYTTTDVIVALQCTMQALERVGKLGRGQADPELELEGTLQLLSTLVNDSKEDATAVSTDSRHVGLT